MAGAIADEKQFAFGDAGNPAPQTKDDFVSESVCNDAGSLVGSNIGILFSEHQGRGSVLHVVKPALDDHFAGRDSEIAKGQHGGVGRWRVPDSEGNFGRIARDLQGIEAFRDQFDDAGVVEVVPECVVEGFQQGGVLRVRVRGLEVGDREADPFYAETGAGANPILGGGEEGRKRENEAGGRKAAASRKSMRKSSSFIAHPFGGVARTQKKICGERSNRSPICSH